MDTSSTNLYYKPKSNSRPTKTADDALISDLPPETLVWIKKRRQIDSSAKVVLSHHRERQLREIFRGIDVGKHGVIDLEELKEAISYVQERIKTVKGLSSFQNIQKVFLAMDDNGDGSVDFQEFTNAMAGTAKSTLDTASEHEIENLHRCFLEFGVLKHRRHAIAKINDYTGLSFTGEQSAGFKKCSVEDESKLEKSEKSASVNDFNRYILFKSLFAEKVDEMAAQIRKEKSSATLFGSTENDFTESVLQNFLEENKKCHPVEFSDPKMEKEFDKLQEKLRQARLQTAKEMKKDPDALTYQIRINEEKRYQAAKKKMQRQQQKNLMRPHTAPNIGNNDSYYNNSEDDDYNDSYAMIETLRDSRFTGSINNNGTNSSTKLLDVNGNVIRNSLYQPTVMPIVAPNASEDLQLQITAKKDAYAILRSLRYLRSFNSSSSELDPEQTVAAATAGTLPFKLSCRNNVVDGNDVNYSSSNNNNRNTNSNLGARTQRRRNHHHHHQQQLQAQLLPRRQVTHDGTVTTYEEEGNHNNNSFYKTTTTTSATTVDSDNGGDNVSELNAAKSWCSSSSYNNADNDDDEAPSNQSMSASQSRFSSNLRTLVSTSQSSTLNDNYYDVYRNTFIPNHKASTQQQQQRKQYHHHLHKMKQKQPPPNYFGGSFKLAQYHTVLESSSNCQDEEHHHHRQQQEKISNTIVPDNRNKIHKTLNKDITSTAGIAFRLNNQTHSFRPCQSNTVRGRSASSSSLVKVAATPSSPSFTQLPRATMLTTTTSSCFSSSSPSGLLLSFSNRPHSSSSSSITFREHRSNSEGIAAATPKLKIRSPKYMLDR